MEGHAEIDHAKLHPSPSWSPLESQSGYEETKSLRPASSIASSSYRGNEIKVPLMQDLGVKSASETPASLLANPRLSMQERRIMDNIVGCLTKDGKKSVAQRIVLDAMGIVRNELEKAKASSDKAAEKAMAEKEKNQSTDKKGKGKAAKKDS